MDIQAKKLWLIEWLLKVQDSQILTRVESIAQEEHDFWDDLPPEAKESIERGLKDYEEGRVFSHEEAMEKVKKKFNL